MISLLKLSDRSGRQYYQGKVLLTMDDGLKIYEDLNNESKMIVWIPEPMRPPEFRLRNMCNEEIQEEEVLDYLVWPEKLLFDNNTGDYCGFITKRPNVAGKLTPLFEYIQRQRCFDLNERTVNAEVGFKIAHIFKTIRDSKHRYFVGDVTENSFLVDDDLNVYYVDSFKCVNDFDGIFKNYYIAPELLLADSLECHFSYKTDAFIYALLLFQVLTGTFPYGCGENIEAADIEKIWNLMCDGISVFYDTEDEKSICVLGEIKKYSDLIFRLFVRAFNYCGQIDYSNNRPSVDEWMEALSEYKSNGLNITGV